MKNPYLDDNGVMRNQFGISNAEQLRDAEYKLTTLRQAQLRVNPMAGNFDVEHLKAIHQHLFNDLYSWAGKEREINVSKRSLTEPGWKTVFASKDDFVPLAKEAHSLSAGQNHLKGLDTEAFSKAVVPVFAKWNELHLFPEGNGRALQTMLDQMAREAGHVIDFHKVPGDYWLDAAETSLQRVNIEDPGLKRPPDLTDLREIFEYVIDAEPARTATNLEAIKYNEYPQSDRAAVQDTVIRSVQANPDSFIDQYKQDTRSFDGRYVAADLFKETFAQFSESNEARNRYNGPVHNAAAVLSAELFRQNLADQSHPERDTVVFLTGIPGAGKTSTVLAAGELSPTYRMVFEGQLANPVTTIEKIQQTIDAGLKPVIMAVHARSEDALDNTIQRYTERGRGAGIGVMSQIQGKLPDSLLEVKKQFGDAVVLHIVDYRNRDEPKNHAGWQHLDILRSEGSHEQILDKLRYSLEQRRESGAISDGAYRQAAGITLDDGARTMDQPCHGKHEADAPGRGLPQGSGEKAVLSAGQQSPPSNDVGQLRADAFLNLDKAKALRQFPELKPVYDALQSAQIKFDASAPNKSPETNKAVMQGLQNQIATKLRTGELVTPMEREPVSRPDRER